MKTLKKLSKTAREWCEFSGYDVKEVKELMGSESFAVIKLENKREMNLEGVDYNYPYILFDPFNLIKTI